MAKDFKVLWKGYRVFMNMDIYHFMNNNMYKSSFTRSDIKIFHSYKHIAVFVQRLIDAKIVNLDKTIDAGHSKFYIYSFTDKGRKIFELLDKIKHTEVNNNGIEQEI